MNGYLRRFYGKVLIPPAVWREVVEEGGGRAVKEQLDVLRAEGLWLSDEAYRRILRDVGEEP